MRAPTDKDDLIEKLARRVADLAWDEFDGFDPASDDMLEEVRRQRAVDDLPPIHWT